jgi:hypothetical protein
MLMSAPGIPAFVEVMDIASTPTDLTIVNAMPGTLGAARLALYLMLACMKIKQP